MQVFNVSTPGTEIVINALDLMRKVPSRSGLVGDVNGSGDITTLDARAILSHVFDAEQLAPADVNGDVAANDNRHRGKSPVVLYGRIC